MATIAPDYIDEQIGYLRTEHEFYIVYDEFSGDETDLPTLRLLLRRAARAAGLRVHTRSYERDAVWVYDPDWHPTSKERKAIDQCKRAATHPRQSDSATEPSHTHHLRALN